MLLMKKIELMKLTFNVELDTDNEKDELLLQQLVEIIQTYQDLQYEENENN